MQLSSWYDQVGHFDSPVHHLKKRVIYLIGAPQWILINMVKIEGEEKKSLQDILLSTAKVINLRVKSQARGQNNKPIALKWGIVHLCNSRGLGDMSKKKKVVPSGVHTHNLGGMSSALCHLGYSTIGPGIGNSDFFFLCSLGIC